MARTVRSSSAELDPLTLVGALPERYPALLESGAATGAASGGRFDILPMTNGECLALSPDGTLEGAHAGTSGGFLSALERWWTSLRAPAHSSALPFTGGWLLYLSYEIAAEIEPRLSLPRGTDPVAALAIRAPAAWIRDRATGQAWLSAEPGHETLLADFERHAAELPSGNVSPGPARSGAAAGGAAPGLPAGWTLEEDDPEEFLESVRRALEYIAAGDVYQANLSRAWRCRSSGPIDPVAIYRRLRRSNPSPFAALLRRGNFALLSSSPERLLSIRGNTVATRPIAGTRPRGATPEADARLVRSLLDNEKERAEHVMLIDLERNDLGRVCIGGSVRVDEYMTVETYAHVHHIVSNVSGLKRSDVTPIGVIRALFPGGTITGCPKIRCMEIIAELERAGRGAYTGSLGYLNLDGSCDLNILIRTMTAERASLKFRAGAGIVADSRPEQELAETRAKAKGLVRALDSTA
ncbi:MAG TPA: aminodeoxychorismate synthase component I [Steroidobacteraceae bacterium]|nr:aminodeoxychorismate synthase component I [Steroidobacteraceae bacterium]